VWKSGSEEGAQTEGKKGLLDVQVCTFSKVLDWLNSSDDCTVLD
jgi:hypothetical protein